MNPVVRVTLMTVGIVCAFMLVFLIFDLFPPLTRRVALNVAFASLCITGMGLGLFALDVGSRG